MYNEQIIEKGIVEKVENGFAEIRLRETGECEECSAKIICKTKDDSTRKINAIDPFGVKPGDEISVSIPGKGLGISALVIYGMPLVLLLLGILIGMSIFESNRELQSSLMGIGLAALYFLLVRSLSGKILHKFIPNPRIISLH